MTRVVEITGVVGVTVLDRFASKQRPAICGALLLGVRISPNHHEPHSARWRAAQWAEAQHQAVLPAV